MQAHSVHLRPATSADEPFLHRLDRAAYEPLAIRLFGSWDDVKQRARFERKLQDLRFRVIELEGRPVGAIASSERADHVFLHEMMILPELQGRGLGSIVLRREIRRAEDAGKPLRLHTARQNRARALYERHGFVETGRDEMFVDMEHACR